jgi:hypothetical protein
MSWRRIVFVVIFAGVVTMAGHLLPIGLGVVCIPGEIASRFLPVFRSARLDISLHIWAWWFVNLLAWALVGELISLAWERRPFRKVGNIAHA